MQAMNTDQPPFYPNQTGPQQGTALYYLQQNGLDPQFSMRNPYPQPQQMPSQYFNPSGTNPYGQPYIVTHSLPAAPFVRNVPRVINPFVPVVRPVNEISNGTQGYIPQQGYSQYPNNNLQQQPNIYSQASYYSYQVPQNFSQQNLTQPPPLSSSQIPNQTQITQPQSQYSISNTQQPTQTSQQSLIDQQLGQSSQSQEKRQRKPIPIVNPDTHQALEVKTLTSSSNASSTTTNTITSTIPTTADDNRHKDSVIDSTIPRTKSINEASKTQEEFRKRVADLLHPNTSTEKNVNQSSTDNQIDETSTKEKQTENILPESTSSASSSRSGSISRPKSPTPLSSNESTSNKSSEQPQPGHPGIRTRSITEDTPNNQDDTTDENNSEKQLENLSINSTSMSDDTINNEIEQSTSSNNIDATIKSESTSSLSTTESLECVTPPQTPTPSNEAESESINIEKTPSISKRYSYTIQELLNKRLAPNSQKRPSDLKAIDGVTNPLLTRQVSIGGGGGGGGGNGGSRGSNISLDRPALQNRSDNAYKRADLNKMDANNKFLRHVKSILNKVTPQKYDELLLKLDELELDRYERLEGMIDIIVSKAVNEPVFSFIYAKLCKHFQKKQVTVPSEDGQTVTHYFRQLLLTRCQKGFESDYRQDIEYEKRKNEVEAITDEKERKDKAEQLEEDLHKAKRRKLGNIFFIGELFKLQMLIDTIMYDCIEYLLRDKTDEESLECLCRLLRTIGKELDAKAGDKTQIRKNLEKHYTELENIASQGQTSSRIRFMIQDLMDLRKANWVARRVEAKPTTIDEIHEQERVKREQYDRDQERERQQRRDQNRSGGGNNQQQQQQQQYSGRGSGARQQTNRIDEQRSENNRFTVNSVRQLQTNDKRNQGQIPLNLAPHHAWNKGSGVDKKPADDRSNAGKTGKPPTGGPVQQFRAKTGTSPGTPGYPIQRQSSRELARGSSQRDRENAMESLRKTGSIGGVTSPNNTNSREGSRNASREQSRNASRESSLSERTSLNKMNTPSPSTTIDTNPLNTSFNEEKTQARVQSLIEEYTENYSDNNDRPIKEAIEDLSDFCTSNIDQQAIIVRELFTKILEAKSRARKAVGHLLDVALHNNILSNEGFLSGFKMVIEVVPDYAVDIPLIWQYIGEIIGAFIGAPSSDMLLLKDILQIVPDEKSKQIFQYIIRYAVEFSSKSRIQRFWQSSSFSLNDLFKSDSIDSSFINEYNWLSETNETEPTTPTIKENLSPRADLQLVKLFKSVNEQNVTDTEITAYIQEHMDPKEKFYIRNIVLSYLEACLINREPQKKIQEDIAKTRMTILNSIIEHKPEAEIQAVYAIQNFVNKLEHPPKMAQLLFDIFYDEECVSEDAFFEWLRHPDQSETEGHSVVEMSTKDFFNWLQQAETEQEEGEEEQN